MQDHFQPVVIESYEDMNKFVFLLIPVPPKLSPFTSDVIQHVGERASLTCSVTKGDLPLTITWLKDGRPLDPSQRVSITQVDQFNSILLIESLSPDHNGNYSCVARNLAAEVSRTQQLVVNGKQDSVSVPFFNLFSFFCSHVFILLLILPVPPIIEPFSFQDGLSEGMRTRTVCGVSRGDPPLAITWLKDGGTISSHLGVNVSALDPYSSLLSISSLASTHSGDYTCVASNPAAEVRYMAKLQVKGNNSNILLSLLVFFFPFLNSRTARSPAVCLRFRCFGTWECIGDWSPRFVSQGNCCTSLVVCCHFICACSLLLHLCISLLFYYCQHYYSPSQ